MRFQDEPTYHLCLCKLFRGVVRSEGFKYDNVFGRERDFKSLCQNLILYRPFYRIQTSSS